jgi:hypothetical protein
MFVTLTLTLKVVSRNVITVSCNINFILVWKFGAESFVFQVAIQKFKDQDI